MEGLFACYLLLCLVLLWPVAIGVIRFVNVHWLDRYEGGCLPPMLAGREKWIPRRGESPHEQRGGTILTDGDVQVTFADELQKLDQLRRDGVLSDAEFDLAKARVLDGEPDDQLAEARYQNELARIDREWDRERQQYLLRGHHGRRDVPTTAAAITVGVVSGVGGLIWLATAVAIVSSSPDLGPFALVKVLFPLFGVAFLVGGVCWAVYVQSMAVRYQAAYKAYQNRRANVMAGPFWG
jgi:hypothetical protein